MHEAAPEYLSCSTVAQTALAENYFGLPYWRENGGITNASTSR
jgi:hypothetical protein